MDRLNISLQLCKAANLLKDPMQELGLVAFKKYERNGLSLTIECAHRADVVQSDLEWAFNLTKKNMEKLYCECEWGWDDDEKFNELTSDSARYLIAKDPEGHPRAFIHFRFDIEYEVEVVYCYEVHLEDELRSKGLGKFMMQILEMLALKTAMRKVVLTAFKHNPEAMRFFKEKLKYEIDEMSPEPEHEPEDPDFYEILSKSMVKNSEQRDHHHHQHNGQCCH